MVIQSVLNDFTNDLNNWWSNKNKCPMTTRVVAEECRPKRFRRAARGGTFRGSACVRVQVTSPQGTGLLQSDESWKAVGKPVEVVKGVQSVSGILMNQKCLINLKGTCSFKHALGPVLVFYWLCCQMMFTQLL